MAFSVAAKKSTRTETDNFLVQIADVVIGQFLIPRGIPTLRREPAKWGTGAEILSYFANGLHEP